MLSFFTAQRTFLAKNLLLLTMRDVQGLFHLSPSQAKYFLRAWTKKGLLTRLKQGLYAQAQHLPPEEEIANVLYQPSYLSFEYALGRFGIMPEMTYAVTSATTKSTRVFSFQEKIFSYGSIKKKAFNGYTAEKIQNRTFLIAEPEKALVDYLYFVSLGRKVWNDRMRLHKLDFKKIEKYALLYERPSLLKLLHRFPYDKQ